MTVKVGSVWFNDKAQELLQVVSYKPHAGLASITLADDDGRKRQFGSERLLHVAGFQKLTSKALPAWAKRKTKIDPTKKFTEEQPMSNAQRMIEAVVSGRNPAEVIEASKQDKWVDQVERLLGSKFFKGMSAGHRAIMYARIEDLYGKMSTKEAAAKIKKEKIGQ